MKLDSHYVDAYVLLGDLDVGREFYIEAIDLYKQALPLAEQLQANGQRFKSMDSRPEAIQKKLVEAYLGRARQLEQPPQPEDAAAKRAEAIAQADQLLAALLSVLSEKDPAYAGVLADAGDAELLKENYAAAQKRYQDSLAHLNDKEIQVKLGRAYLMAGNLAGAQATFNAVLHDDPHWAPAHLGLADVYRAQGQPKQALSEYKLAFAQGEALDYPERRQIALTALEIDPKDAEMHLLLADYYLKQHVYQGAIEEYQAILKLQPHSAAAFEGLGKVSQDKLEYAPAEQYFKMALEANPSPEQQVGLYQEILKAEQGAAGPGKPVGEEGQNALYQLATLYLKSGGLAESWQALRELQQRYPTYRPDDVAQLVQQLTKAVGDNLPGQPVADQGHQIIAPGESHPAYNSNPPASGWHYTLPAEWGIHDASIPDEVQLRNLASGGVLIQYNPDLTPETLRQLRSLVAELRKDQRYCQLILAPRAQLDHEITLSAWLRFDRLDGFDQERMVRFIDTLIGRGPEVGEVGCSL
jgi:Tfp pilus assembly protein PilF